MSDVHLARLRAELGLDAPADDGGTRITVWRFTLGGGELPGWRLLRVYPLADPETGRAVTQTIWGRGEGDAELLRVDAIECASRQDAREALLALAGEMERGDPPKRVDDMGEVALEPSRSNRMLARGNLVLRVASVGRQTQGVAEEAARLDRWVTDGGRGEQRKIALAELAKLPREADDRQRWYRLTTTVGEVVLERGQPVLRHRDGIQPPGLDDGAVTVTVVEAPTK